MGIKCNLIFNEHSVFKLDLHENSAGETSDVKYDLD